MVTIVPSKSICKLRSYPLLRRVAHPCFRRVIQPAKSTSVSHAANSTRRCHFARRERCATYDSLRLTPNRASRSSPAKPAISATPHQAEISTEPRSGGLRNPKREDGIFPLRRKCAVVDRIDRGDFTPGARQEACSPGCQWLPSNSTILHLDLRMGTTKPRYYQP